MSKASIIMIDCDLYNSTKLLLEFVTDIVQDGAILIFDDWFAYKGNRMKGEQLAANEWPEKNSKFKLIPFSRYGVYRNSFIVSIDEKIKIKFIYIIKFIKMSLIIKEISNLCLT